MKLKTILTALFIGTLFFYGFSAEKPPVIGPETFEFDQYLIDRLPGGYFYPFFFENYVPDATFLTEENNGFSLIDNPRVYFEGDSFVNFNWFYNGLNINSGLNDGSPGILLPFSSLNTYRLQGESPLFNNYGMNFISTMPQESFSRVTLSPVYSNLGGYWLKFMIQPDHPTSRPDRLYTERRKINTNYYVDYQLSKKLARSQFTLGLSYFDIQRKFNDFNTFNATYKEDGRLFLMDTRWQKDLKNGSFNLFGIFNYLDRGNQLAETGSYPQETIEKKRYAFLTGFALKKKKLDLTLGLLFEKEDLSPFQRNFSKDLMDNDGDGFYPYGDSGELKIGTFSNITGLISIKYPLSGRSARGSLAVDTFADLRFSSLKGDEDINDYNALLFNNTPYQVVLWNKANSYRNSNINAKAGINLQADFSKDISLLGKFYLDYNGLNFDDSANNLSFFKPAFDIGLLLFKTRKTRLLFSYGIIPYDIRENTNFFLERERPSGTLHWWNDINGDTLYQPGEAGGIFGYTGGQYHYAGENLAAPLKERLLLYLSFPLSKNFRMNIKGIYKRIKNRFRVSFKEEYGFYESLGGYDIYFFDRPFRDYYLTNGGFEKDPFYGQFSFDITGQRIDKWFFYFSFMAHMGMGDTAFGNGPGSNDIGILDESQANPNSWINGFGRVDGDRGFVSKCYCGYYIFKKLFLGISFKYRDGDPFAFFNTLSRYNQRVIYYKTIKAENEKGIKGGPRENYVADVSLKLSYHFNLFNQEAVASFSVFNILDFGAELSEYAFSGGERDARELQIPRSLRFTLCLKF